MTSLLTFDFILDGLQLPFNRLRSDLLRKPLEVRAMRVLKLMEKTLTQLEGREQLLPREFSLLRPNRRLDKETPNRTKRPAILCNGVRGLEVQKRSGNKRGARNEG